MELVLSDAAAMSVKSYNCRFCGEPFVPDPASFNKTGYIDECPECFRVRTHPARPDDPISRLERDSPLNRKRLARLRSYLLSKGIEASEVDRRIAKALEAD
jgi:hypothetical protein